MTGRLAAIALTVLVLLGSEPSASSPHFYDDDPLNVEVNTQDASGVQPWEIDLAWDLAQNLFVRPGNSGSDRRAVNVNSIDEVPDGAWFTNRAGTRPLTDRDVARGANTGLGPVPGRWVVVAAKSDGITPGFTVRDERGDIWFLKFDPPGWRGMATGTEVTVAKLFWALGYHTPEYYISQLRADDLAIDPQAEITPPRARPRAMKKQDIAWLLTTAERDPDGSYRVIASKALPGKPVGRFRFFGTRPDDPNDVYPHEHRRELRAYGTFAAWFNHVDAKSINTLDTLVAENGRTVVRHHLLDFGSTLGSAAVGPRDYWEGHEHLVEPRTIGKGIVGFGFYIRPWRTMPVYEDRHIGRIDRDDSSWDPETWKARVPNPAFVRSRPDDKFWAARKAAAITDDMIRAAVSSGEFGGERAEVALIKVLSQRRDAIVRRYLPAVNPIVDPALASSGTLRFANAAVAAGVAREPEAYRATWASFDNATGETRELGASTGPSTGIQAPAGVPSTQGAYLRVAIAAVNGPNAEWEKPVHAFFRRLDAGWKLVGFERLPHRP